MRIKDWCKWCGAYTAQYVRTVPRIADTILAGIHPSTIARTASVCVTCSHVTCHPDDIPMA